MGFWVVRRVFAGSAVCSKSSFGEKSLRKNEVLPLSTAARLCCVHREGAPHLVFILNLPT